LMHTLDQAIAIGISEVKDVGYKVPEQKADSKTKSIKKK